MRPEPVGGALFGRVVRSNDYVAVGVVDLSGSARGSWSEPTGPGRCRSVRAACSSLLRSAGRRRPPFSVAPTAASSRCLSRWSSTGRAWPRRWSYPWRPGGRVLRMTMDRPSGRPAAQLLALPDGHAGPPCTRLGGFGAWPEDGRRSPRQTCPRPYEGPPCPSAPLPIAHGAGAPGPASAAGRGCRARSLGAGPRSVAL